MPYVASQEFASKIFVSTRDTPIRSCMAGANLALAAACAVTIAMSGKNLSYSAW